MLSGTTRRGEPCQPAPCLDQQHNLAGCEFLMEGAHGYFGDRAEVLHHDRDRCRRDLCWN